MNRYPLVLGIKIRSLLIRLNHPQHQQCKFQTAHNVMPLIYPKMLVLNHPAITHLQRISHLDANMLYGHCLPPQIRNPLLVILHFQISVMETNVLMHPPH